MRLCLVGTGTGRPFVPSATLTSTSSYESPLHSGLPLAAPLRPLPPGPPCSGSAALVQHSGSPQVQRHLLSPTLGSRLGLRGEAALASTSFPSVPPQGQGAGYPSPESFLFPRPGPSRTLTARGQSATFQWLRTPQGGLGFLHGG